MGEWPNQPKLLLNLFSGGREYSSPVYPWQVTIVAWLSTLAYIGIRVLNGLPLHKQAVVFQATLYVSMLMVFLVAIFAGSFGIVIGGESISRWYQRRLQKSCQRINLR